MKINKIIRRCILFPLAFPLGILGIMAKFVKLSFTILALFNLSGVV